MTYALIKDGAVVEYPVYEGEIKQRFPSTSFPLPFLPPDGYVLVHDAPAPQAGHEEDFAEVTPVLIDGTWTRAWEVTPAEPAVIAERVAQKEQEIRSRRNSLLANTDWTQLADCPVDSSEWAAYRQELRDLPSQEGFPWQVEWPQPPA